MKNRPSTCLVLSLLAGAGLCVCVPAQQPASAKQAAAKPPARQVVLPVTVIDKHGALVTNLTAKDFTLTEDGRPQVIQSLTTQGSLPFRLGLLIETSRGVYSAINEERKATEKFIDLMLPAEPNSGSPGNGSSPPGQKPAAASDQAFLIHFDREVELLEDFTASRSKLDREIEEMTPTARERNDPQGPETSSSDRENGRQGEGRRDSTQLYDAIYLASDELMKTQHGHKALIVLSGGVDRGSKETMNDAIDAADRANLEVCTIYFKGEAEREPGTYPQGGHHGGGYPGGGGGYPGGGGGWPGGGGSRRGGSNEPQVDGKKMMQEIAQRTGGMFFEAKKRDNIEDAFGLVASGLHQQYLLAYTPDQTGDEGEFHKIVLKTTNADYTVEVREGYYNPDEK